MKLIIESDKIIIDGIEYVPVKKEIQVGDRVRVVNPGKRYGSYQNWPGWEKVPLEYAIRYTYGGGAWDNSMTNKETFRVIHTTYKDLLTNVTIALIESEKYGECYLFNVDGLEKVG